MVEQITANDHYELMKILASVVDPREFPHVAGLVFFKIKQQDENTYKIILDDRIFHDDWLFLEAVEEFFYGFVQRSSEETILGFRFPKMMGEFFWDGKVWQMREIDDFRFPPQTPAEMRFEVSKDYENLKKFLS